MNMEISNEKIELVKEKIVREFKPEKIILFGSYAWGTPDENSDIDLFIVKETEDTRKMAREIDGSIFPRPFPIDIIVYTPENVKKRLAINDFFIRDIFDNGKLLYGSK
ncbi:MAG: nucleotidyltransferase domain-containing protein [Parcubacteria group bacterium]